MSKNKTASRIKKKIKKVISEGIAHIQCSFNNTIITITDLNGNKLTASSAGVKYSGSRKSTPFAAQDAAKVAGTQAMEDYKMQTLKEVRVKGPGTGRDSSVRALNDLGFKIVEIVDKTGIPHNGCRPPKERSL